MHSSRFQSQSDNSQQTGSSTRRYHVTITAAVITAARSRHSRRCLFHPPLVPSHRMSTFRAPQGRRPTLPPPLPISAMPAASRAAPPPPPPLPTSMPGGIISPRAASNPSDSPTSTPYQPFASPSSSPLDSYTAAKRDPSPLELAPRSSSLSSPSGSKSCFDYTGDRRRLLFCLVLIILLLLILIIIASLAGSGKLSHSQSNAAAGGQSNTAQRSQSAPICASSHIEFCLHCSACVLCR
jgi:hypothetical protein